MLKVGLTGGYATGKSFVAAELELLGCHVIYADRLGHAALSSGGAAYASTLEAFGPSILDANREIDRKRLGEIVFGSPEVLEKLNGFVHPAVFRLTEQLMGHYREQDPLGIVAYEAAILIETGRYSDFDRLIVTVCDDATRVARGMKRDHLNREQILERIARQLPVDDQKKYAHYVVDTSGDKHDTILQVQHIYGELKHAANAQQA